MNGPYTSKLKDAAQAHDNLSAYVHRMSKEWFENDPMSLAREVSKG
jgi:hypothetical protein